MFRNYLTTALNNLARNRLYAAITILGLAVAFAVAILVGQFVRGEFNYDRWIPGHGQIYKIVAVLQPVGRKPLTLDATQDVAGGLKAGLPGVVSVARLSESGAAVRRRAGEEGATEWLLAWADPDVFKVFPLPALAGDPTSALQQPDTVVITRRMARKYFGRDLPIGGSIEVQDDGGRWHALRVTAVLKDLPAETNLKDELFASGRSAFSKLSDIDAHPRHGSFWLGLRTFVRAAPGAGPAQVQRAIDAAGRPEVETFRREGAKVAFRAAPLDDLHWMANPGPANPGDKPAGDKGVTYGIAAVAGLIVLVAAINFVTLMTARASRRGVEVGVRKAAGATRGDLIVQFMGEALLQVALSAVIAAAMAEVMVRPFGVLVQRALRVDLVHDPLLLAGLAGFTLLVGVLSSIYPALVLSGFRPQAVLKGGTLPASGSPLARASLVAVQFAVLVGLALTTATIWRQTQFALAQGMGAANSQRIVAAFGGCHGAFPDAVRRLPGVEAVACSTQHALNLAGLTQAVQTGGGARADFHVAPVDFGFLELYGVRPLAGRLFSRDHGQDNALADIKASIQPTVILNETAARALGYAKPDAAIGRQMAWTRALTPEVPAVTGRSEIVGVVPDIPATVRAVVDPTFYFILPNTGSQSYSGLLSIKLTGQDVPGTVRAIERAWKRTGPTPSLDEFFLSQLRSNAYVDLEIQGQAMAICAGLAILLACLGLFGLSAYVTERRTKEIGVRKAMGADTFDIVLLLLWQFTTPVLCAIAVATPVGLWAMHDWLSQFAYRIVLSPWTFLLAAAAAVLIAWLTVGWQSYVVARARPAGALLYE